MTQFGHGIEVFTKSGQAVCTEIKIIGNTVVDSGKHGIAVIDFTGANTIADTIIVGNNVKNSGTDLANTYSAVYLEECKNTIVSDNILTDYTGTRTKYIIEIGTNATLAFCDNNIMIGGVTGKISGTQGAGSRGELIESNIGFGSAVSLTSGVAANVTSITLTAGDWEVSGWIGFLTAGTTTVSYIAGSISDTSATFQGASTTRPRVDYPWTFATGGDPSVPLGAVGIKVTSNTTFYLVASSNFAVSTNGAFGYIRARRIREA
jgi:hypothetical protein